MKKYYYNKCKASELEGLTKRSSIDFKSVFTGVEKILADVKAGGLQTALEYSQLYDGFKPDNIMVTADEFKQAVNELDTGVKKAIDIAAENIRRFHELQIPEVKELETSPGVRCRREYRPVENAALYIPGGTAPLPSTMLMLGIPASIAGCKRVAGFSPTKDGTINSALLYAADNAGVTEFYKIGGAQAVALMAYGCAEIKRFDKIFGPGNSFVTAAKSLVSIDPEGCAIDMPAGPSEVLIISDGNVDPAFTASDMLSQLEHGTDSQAVLVTTNESFADEVIYHIYQQQKNLNRKTEINKSLGGSFILVVNDIETAFRFSNNYAPEHLILQLENAEKFTDKVNSAGSVFVGNYTPESAGDYASGTNHSLPTYGYARAYGGLSVEMFMKSVTFQQISRAGLEGLAETITALAEVESLDAHANSVNIRMQKND